MTLSLLQPGLMIAGGSPGALGPPRSIAPDCRHYRGDRPCLHHRLCGGCPHYAPYRHRLCIIRLGPLGDVIRTLCLLPALHREYPDGHVTWVSQPEGCRMIAGHRLIQRVLPFDTMSVTRLQQETFDAVICLDRDAGPCALATALFARRKLGVGLSAWGTPAPMNAQAEAYFRLGLSDHLRFEKNTHSYPRLVHEALGLTYRGQKYELPVDDARTDRLRMRLAAAGWQPGRLTLGVDVGAGESAAGRMWPAERLVEALGDLLAREPDLQVVLLGGSQERLLVDRVLAGLGPTPQGARVMSGGTEHDEPGFVALVNVCDAVFSGDTMALHVAVALGKPVVALFGPTPAQEVDLFGRGTKLTARPSVDAGQEPRAEARAGVEAIGRNEALRALAQVLEQVRAESVGGRRRGTAPGPLKALCQGKVAGPKG